MFVQDTLQISSAKYLYYLFLKDIKRWIRKKVLFEVENSGFFGNKVP